jgi:hypothetical protein
MPKERKPWLRDKYSDADRMSLPKGQTCGDCVFFRRCAQFTGHIAADQVCDYAPSLFQPARPQLAAVPA